MYLANKLVALTALTLTLTLALSAPTFAQDAKAIDGAVKARKAQMALYAFNLGILGTMAKGQSVYDASVAQGAASSLLALTRLDASQMWPAGSEQGAAAGSRAKPEMWNNMDDVIAKAMEMQAAAEAMDGAAGQGLEAMQAAMGGVGGACSACHKAYRGPKG
jgi:cytochrome c556